MTFASVLGMKKYFKNLVAGMMGGIMILVGASVGAPVMADEPAGDVGEMDVGEVNDTVVLPRLYFKAVNPGYVIDGVNNVGEMIEIARGGDSDEMISLAGVTVRYTNTSGKESVLAEFPENGFMAGEKILLRLASSPGSELANLTYKKTLAMNASLTLTRDEEVLDVVCFSGKGECLAAFNKNTPTTLVRNLTTGEFEHVEGYEPVYDEGSYIVRTLEDEAGSEKTDEAGSENLNQKPDEDEKSGEDVGAETGVDGSGEDEKLNEKPDEGDEEGEGKGAAMGHCKGLQFSEILSYYAESQTEQFVEIYNAGAEQVLMDGCALRYKKKLYPLSGIVKPEEYAVRWAEDFKLTKNPTNYNLLEIIDEDGTVVDEMTYPNGQKKGVAYAMFGYDEKGEEIWHTTYAATPGEANNYQEYRTCEEGKVINEETGNCVKASTVVEKTCAAGQYLNPLTGRCKKIETEEEKVCQEGYYLYAPTGRCRKVVENDGAEYNLAASEGGDAQKESSFVAVYAVIGVLGLGVIYIIYEYRKEIVRGLKRLFQRK